MPLTAAGGPLPGGVVACPTGAAAARQVRELPVTTTLSAVLASLPASEVMQPWLERAKVLRTLYGKSAEFPLWVLSLARTETFDRVQAGALVFYTQGEKRSDVKKLFLQREPVNIGLARHCNRAGLQKFFGWEYGFYREATKQLAPNIAVYTPAYCLLDSRPHISDVPKGTSELQLVHIADNIPFPQVYKYKRSLHLLQVMDEFQ